MSRHDVLAVEIRDPREQELPDVGELWLVDPETGRQVRVDTRSATLRERFAAAAAEERSGVARVAVRARRPARRALDLRRLAARVRDFLGAAPVSFARPLALVALVAVPVLVAALAPARAAAQRAAPRASPTLALLPNLVDRRPGRLRHRPARAPPARARGDDRRRRATARERSRCRARRRPSCSRSTSRAR